MFRPSPTTPGRFAPHLSQVSTFILRTVEWITGFRSTLSTLLNLRHFPRPFFVCHDPPAQDCRCIDRRSIALSSRPNYLHISTPRPGVNRLHTRVPERPQQHCGLTSAAHFTGNNAQSSHVTRTWCFVPHSRHFLIFVI